MRMTMHHRLIALASFSATILAIMLFVLISQITILKKLQDDSALRAEEAVQIVVRSEAVLELQHIATEIEFQGLSDQSLKEWNEAKKKAQGIVSLSQKAEIKNEIQASTNALTSFFEEKILPAIKAGNVSETKKLDDEFDNLDKVRKQHRLWA